jgi:hypothetical protein
VVLHLAAVYLTSLASLSSRRTMRVVLDTIAALLTDRQQDSQTLTWGALRLQHTSAIQGSTGGTLQAHNGGQDAGGAAWRAERCLCIFRFA